MILRIVRTLLARCSISCSTTPTRFPTESPRPWRRAGGSASFGPVVELAADLAPTIAAFADRFHLTADEQPLLTRLTADQPFDRRLWRHLAGEVLLYAAADAPAIQTAAGHARRPGRRRPARHDSPGPRRQPRPGFRRRSLSPRPRRLERRGRCRPACRRVSRHRPGHLDASGPAAPRRRAGRGIGICLASASRRCARFTSRPATSESGRRLRRHLIDQHPRHPPRLGEVPRPGRAERPQVLLHLRPASAAASIAPLPPCDSHGIWACSACWPCHGAANTRGVNRVAPYAGHVTRYGVKQYGPTPSSAHHRPRSIHRRSHRPRRFSSSGRQRSR